MPFLGIVISFLPHVWRQITHPSSGDTASRNISVKIECNLTGIDFTEQLFNFQQVKWKNSTAAESLMYCAKHNDTALSCKRLETVNDASPSFG